MKSKMLWRLVAVAVLLGAASSYAGIVTPNYEENGDAGPRASPQNVTPPTGNLSNSPYGGFSGTIGAPGTSTLVAAFDEFDAFRFYFPGGTFTATYEASGKTLEQRLFTDALIELASVQTGDTEVWSGLAPGNYIYELQAVNDPDYTVTSSLFFAPRPVAVAEPGSALLMLLGIGALTLARRRT